MVTSRIPNLAQLGQRPELSHHYIFNYFRGLASGESFLQTTAFSFIANPFSQAYTAILLKAWHWLDPLNVFPANVQVAGLYSKVHIFLRLWQSAGTFFTWVFALAAAAFAPDVFGVDGLFAFGAAVLLAIAAFMPMRPLQFSSACWNVRPDSQAAWRALFWAKQGLAPENSSSPSEQDVGLYSRVQATGSSQEGLGAVLQPRMRIGRIHFFSIKSRLSLVRTRYLSG